MEKIRKEDNFHSQQQVTWKIYGILLIIFSIFFFFFLKTIRKEVVKVESYLYIYIHILCCFQSHSIG